jgi:hypothetical protein
MKLSSLHFHLSMPTLKFEEEKDSIKIVFSHTKVVFSPPKSAKKQHQNRLFAHEGRLFPSKICEKRPEYDNFGLFLWPSIIALYKKSSLCFKSIDFLPKINRYVYSQTIIFIKSLSKKGATIKLAKILM